MTNGVTLDVMAMVELARRHPDELARLKESILDAGGVSEREDGGGEGLWIPSDRFQRTLALGSLVLTANGERGRITRFDRHSERAVVELDQGGTRFLKLSKIELRRGRPRKESYATSQ